jgi:hypothetical protein
MIWGALANQALIRLDATDRSLERNVLRLEAPQ